MLDSVRTFVCKHQHSHSESRLLALAIERGVVGEQTTEADLALHCPQPEGEGHFRCYDAVAERLGTGLTLSTRDVRRMLATTHHALHQDRRFYDTADGHWYLAHQTPCNDELAVLLKDIAGELLPLADLMAGMVDSPCFWTSDSRFTLQDGLVSFRLPEPESGFDEFEFLDLGSSPVEVALEIPEFVDFDLFAEPTAEVDLDLFAQMQAGEEPESPDHGVDSSEQVPTEVADSDQSATVAFTESIVAIETPSPEVIPDSACVEQLFEKLARLQNLRSGLKV